MDIVMKIFEGKDGVFKNPDDVIKYMYETNFEREVTVYDINPNKAYKKTASIYDAIKKYNEGKCMDEQILPSNPFMFRGILGCLGVQCFSITLGTYKRNHESIALFTGFNKDVLDTSTYDEHVKPSLKALYYLGVLNKMM